jgi:ethanolamine ammonia-lyase small subunit
MQSDDHSGESAPPPVQQPQPDAGLARDGQSAPVLADPWSPLRRFTQARIALGHTGTSLPTRPHLEFQLAHAQARDAVHRALDVEALRAQLGASAVPMQLLHSAASDRQTYLQRPDLGRRLDANSRAALLQLRHAWSIAGTGAPDGDATGSTALEPDHLERPWVMADVLFVLADGLSARAIQDHAAPFLDQILPRLAADGFRVAPWVVTVQQGRVAVGDEIGEILGVRLVVVLIGERPGLSSPDSMGIYLSYQPHVGMTDAARNCISNIRPDGLSCAVAAHKLHYLITEACRRRLTGVMLKDEALDPGADSGRLASPAANLPGGESRRIADSG